MNVNISGRQLAEEGFVELVADALRHTLAPARHVTFEITESVIMQRTEDTLTTLRALKELGVRLAIDDFGTGYSSLSYLQKFPVDVLKIDRAFVEGVARGGSDAALARTIIALGDTLGLRTVAEGVEALRSGINSFCWAANSDRDFSSSDQWRPAMRCGGSHRRPANVRGPASVR